MKLAASFASLLGLALVATAVALPSTGRKASPTPGAESPGAEKARLEKAKTDLSLEAKSSDAKLTIELDSAAAVKLQRSGIYPASLSAAGLTPLEAVQVINRAKDFFSTDSTLASADAAVAASKPTIEPLSTKVKAGKATYEEALALSAAREALATAEAAQEVALANVLTAATSGATAQQQQTLTRIQQNKHWRLPVQYLVLTQEEPAWVRLRDALDAVTSSGAEGWPTPQAALDLISLTRENPAVAAAEQGLAAHLAELQAAWDSALQK
jgi:hypothetical protein